MAKKRIDINGKKMQNLHQEFIQAVRFLNPLLDIRKSSVDECESQYWDYLINQQKFFLKEREGIKNYNLENDSAVVVELLTPTGEKGWLFGDANYIAFEFQGYGKSSFIFVPRIELQKFIESNVNNVYEENIYRSFDSMHRMIDGRTVTLIRIDDLKKLPKVEERYKINIVQNVHVNNYKENLSDVELDNIEEEFLMPKAVQKQEIVIDKKPKEFPEIFVPVNGYEGCYEISNKGRVKSLGRYVIAKGGHTRFKPKRILNGFSKDNDYLSVTFSIDNVMSYKYIHILVAEHFLPKPTSDRMVVKHINGDRSNNCVDNLKWMTLSDYNLK